MRVDSLQLRRAPGLPDGLPEVELPGGLVLIVGPNASGKSTLVRLIRALLWPGGADTTTEASGRWRTDAGAYTANLFAGRVDWDPTVPPGVAPGGAALARFDLRSLLDDGDEHDRELARRLVQELAGGLDLVEARQRFERPEPRGLVRDLKDARVELRKAQRNSRDLASQEEHLEEIADEIEEARAAGRSRDAAKALKNVVQAEETLAKIKVRIAELPEGLDDLHGDEAEEINNLGEKLSEHKEIAASLKGELADAESRRDGLAFPEAPPSDDEVETWTKRLEAAKDLANEVERLRGELGGAEAMRDDALARVAAAPSGDDVDIADDALDRVAAAIAERREVQAQYDAAIGVAKAWAKWVEDADGDDRALRAATNALRGWLRSTGADAAKAAGLPTWAVGLLLVTGALCGVLAIAFDQPWLVAGLVLAGVGVGVLLERRVIADAAGAVRDTHRCDAERSGLPPERWDAPIVEAHLRSLEDRLEKLALANRSRERAEAENERAAVLEAIFRKSEKDLQETAKAAGITTKLVELGAIQQVQALVELAKSRTAVTKIDAECRVKTNSLNGFLRDAGDWLVTLGLEAPSDVAAAQVRISSVGTRLTGWQAAKNEIRDKTTPRDRVLDEIERIGAELSEVWARSGVETGDVAGMQRRLEVLETWSSFQEAQQDAKATLRAARTLLDREEDLGELDGRQPVEVPEDEVEEWINSYGERAARLEGLNEEKGRIGQELDDAAKGTTFADALARFHDAERRLAVEREQAAEDAVARLLLDEARDSHKATHVPRVLARAQSFFQRFTHDGWRIEVDRDDSFGALDVAAQERRSLDALSDGTRAQLLLAARIAALEELEQGGEQLPICLDEALSNCDPVRFREIAGALLELVADGRQVIYATADPAEAEQWRQACRDLGHPQPATVDLGALRDPSHDWGGVLPAVPEAPEPIPDPANTTPKEYARAVGALPPDGFEQTSLWNLYVVAYDDLDALAVCLRHRLSRVGPWREARRTGRTPRGIDDRAASRFDKRCAIAEAVARAWSIGRGRPVKWDDVEASEAVSDRYAEDVRELLAKYSRNPEQFVDAVGDIGGFRKAKAEDLRTHLENEGVLPTVTPLTREDLVRRALSGAPNAVESLDPEHSAAYVEWLLDLIETNA
jgi:DNA repair exonuclease SbcCD ATPase subunit